MKYVLLRSTGLVGCTYCYQSQLVPYLQNRIKHILTDRKNRKPDYILLHCAGNDLETYGNADVIEQYDFQIDEVRNNAPKTTILLDVIPLKGEDPDLLICIGSLTFISKTKQGRQTM